jgi:hypothetical protein
MNIFDTLRIKIRLTFGRFRRYFQGKRQKNEILTHYDENPS